MSDPTPISPPSPQRPWLEGLGVLIACLSLLTIIQFATPAPVGTDGYYHMRMAALIRERGLKPEFVWLPLTILNPDEYYNHHLLYHVALAALVPALPGASPSDAALIAGAKVTSVVIPALAFWAIWRLLRDQGVAWAWLWALGLFAVSDAFLFRMSMVRAQAASLLILSLALGWLLRGKHWPLIPLGFAYVWTYDAFPLLLVIGGAVAGAILLAEGRLEWRAVVFPLVGIALGLVLNLYFPHNLVFIAQHLLPKVGGTETGLGNEWFPYETWTLVENSAGALAAFALATFALGWRGQRMNAATLAALALAVIFGLLLFKARRFVEYYPAFALIFLALSAGPLLADWVERVGRARWLGPATLALLMIAPLAYTVIRARATLADQRPASDLADAARWLRDHTPPGSLVFQTDWDDFPRLFFYNTSNVYTLGLDVTYMSQYDPALYDEWVDITRGRVERPSRLIRADFGAGYVVTDLEHGPFLARAADDPGLREVYRDDEAAIFEVLPAAP